MKGSVDFTVFFETRPPFAFIRQKAGIIIAPQAKKEGRNTDMKELLYEFATLLLATAQAAWLVWISTVFVR